jgi:hypothetical protein
MINSSGLDILFGAWCRDNGCSRTEPTVTDLQKRARVLTGFADSGKLRYDFVGQTAFIYLIETNEIGGGTTVPPIVSVKGADYSNVYEEWFPGLPPLQFVNPICVCREFFEIDVDNKLDPGVQPVSGNIDVYAHFLLARPPYKESGNPRLY